MDVIAKVHRHRSFKIFNLFAESVGQPGQPTAVHPQSEVLPLNMGRANLANVWQNLVKDTKQKENNMQRDIGQYRLVTEPVEKTLQDKVNDLIAKGWQPLGGVAVASGGDGNCDTIYVQAMVRYMDSNLDTTP